VSRARRAERSETATGRAARQLRAQILRSEQGAHLGSEDGLMAQLGVSRPTLRQAARLLEHEQLLDVRRGVGGGYYVRKPDVDSVTRAAAFYLRARKTTLRDLLVAAGQMTEVVMLRAAQSRDSAARPRLVRAVADLQRPLVGPAKDADLLARDLELVEAVCELAANPPLELFIRTLYAVGLAETSTRIFREREDRVSAWAESRAQLGEAILAGDTELTLLLCRRSARQVLGWIASDLGEAPAEALASLARESFGPSPTDAPSDSS
jgi:DNA-binding FadR family transcriptional regulator